MRSTIATLLFTCTIASFSSFAAVQARPAKAKVTAPAIQPVLDATTSLLLEEALSGKHRSPEDKARGAYRHPGEMLAFFGLTSTQTVIEISPGRGWWTDVLAPVLRDKGKLQVAMNTDINGDGRRGLAQTLTRFSANPALFEKVQIVHDADTATQETQFGASGQADMVLLFRVVHHLIGKEIASHAFKLYFEALKPGGILAVEQHRWPESKAYPLDATTGKPRVIGYLKESDVIALATAAGFKLAARSEMNANPNDTKDYPNDVWSLPPALRGGDLDKARYLAIGESDRMVLKFVKPGSK
jgi:predicted methyltransferase